MNLERELHRAKKYELISFDIFDTLVERKVETPVDIFLSVGEKYFNNNEEAKFFQKKRIMAENVARHQSLSSEVNLDDIYNVIEYEKKDVEALKYLEIKTELNMCFPRVKFVNLFEKLKNEGTRIALISDMYLPTEVVEGILTKCGIAGYDMLFISNVYGCDKISGKLFEVVHKHYGMQSVSHLHYGDSFKADVLGARKAKVATRFVFKRNWIKRLMRKFV